MAASRYMRWAAADQDRSQLPAPPIGTIDELMGEDDYDEDASMGAPANWSPVRQAYGATPGSPEMAEADEEEDDDLADMYSPSNNWYRPRPDRRSVRQSMQTPGFADYRQSTPMPAYRQTPMQERQMVLADAPPSSARHGFSEGRLQPMHDAAVTSLQMAEDDNELRAEEVEFKEIWDEVASGDMEVGAALLEFETVCRRRSRELRQQSTQALHSTTRELLLERLAQLLDAEAATWRLLWHRLWYTPQRYDDNEFMTSTAKAAAAIHPSKDPLTWQCACTVSWLEAMAAEQLRADQADQYTDGSAVWRETRTALELKQATSDLVSELDPDAPTREGKTLHPDNQSSEVRLLSAVWRRIRAGQLGQARALCRHVGQDWRAASLGGCGDSGPTPLMQAEINDTNEDIAIELENGTLRQRFLWKWSCFKASEMLAEEQSTGELESAIYGSLCSNTMRMLAASRDWESACWAMFRSWLDVRVDQHLAQSVSKDDDERDAPKNTGRVGDWPLAQVCAQQPAEAEEIFRQLASSPYEAVRQACREPQRQVQMHVILCQWTELVHVLNDWLREDPNTGRPLCPPQLLRCAAHVMLALQRLLPETELSEGFDFDLNEIVHAYIVHLISAGRYNLVALYASFLRLEKRRYDFTILMDTIRGAEEEVKKQVFETALQYFDQEGPGSIFAIIDRVIAESREHKPEYPADFSAGPTAEIRKARLIEWLCFPIAGNNTKQVEMHQKAVFQSNLLFREFALASLPQREQVDLQYLNTELQALPDVSARSEGAALLMSKLPQDIAEALSGSAAIRELGCWLQYFECDAEYRDAVELCRQAASAIKQGVVPTVVLKEAAVAAAQSALEQLVELLAGEEAWLELPRDARLDDELLSCSGTEVINVVASVTGGQSQDYFTIQDAMVKAAGDAARVTCVVEPVSDGDLVSIHLAQKFGKGDEALLAPAGGVLARVLSLAVKGELPDASITIRPCSLEVVVEVGAQGDSSTDAEQQQESQLAVGLCRRCLAPELALRCLEMEVAIAALTGSRSVNPELAGKAVELVANGPGNLHQLFTQSQLKLLLQLERQAVLFEMQAAHDQQTHAV
eukprot:jgi/Chlat1/7458/Chrsp6S07470